MTLETATIPLTSYGIAQTVLGSLEVSQGHILQGVKSLFSGMAAVHLSGRLQLLDDDSHSELLKCSLAAGTGAVGLQGAFRIANGVTQKRVSEILRGGLQAAVGGLGGVCIFSLDARILNAAHQASVIILPSAILAKSGFHDMAQGRYRSGLGKMLLGLGGVTSAGYSIYSAAVSENSNDSMNSFENNLELQRQYFLKSHEYEIDFMCSTGRAPDKWEFVGKGISKWVVAPPNLSGYVLKIPHGPFGKDAIEQEYQTLQKLQNVAKGFDRIVLPKTSLYTTSNGPLLVSERLRLVDLNSALNPLEAKKAMDQFLEFKKQFRLCDFAVETNRNAGFVAGTDHSKIGVLDVDCNVDEKNRNFLIHVLRDFIGSTGLLKVACNWNRTNFKNMLLLSVLAGLALEWVRRTPTHNDPDVYTTPFIPSIFEVSAYLTLLLFALKEIRELQ